MDANMQPIGDQWNFDKDNRKGISQLKSDIPKRKNIKSNQVTFDAMIDVEDIFP